MDFLFDVVAETARVFYEGSLFILLGFFVAGLLHEFLPAATIARHLSGERRRSVVLAALFGAPIPLCSCGVLPAAAALRQKGASRAATLSFTISTPETGVDSIALSYGLLGPVMAVVRPLVAIATAITAGWVAMFGREDPRPDPDPGEGPCQDPNHPHAHPDPLEARDPAADPWRTRGQRVLDYGFGTLLDEIAFWIVVGVFLTGILSALLPDDFFTTVLGWDRGIVPMVAMIVAGVPLYLCASASTPVAAALIAKGLSPGAALVFLLVGPATNAATIAVVGRLLGAHSLRIYLASIIVVALAGGLLLDATLADTVRAQTLAGSLRGDAPLLSGLKVLAALGFVALIGRSFLHTRFREGLHDAGGQIAGLGRWLAAFQLRDLLRPPVAAGLALFAFLAAGPECLLVVEPGQRGIVQRFGRVVASDLEPGLHVHWPPPIGKGRAVDVERVRRIPIGFRVEPVRGRELVPVEAYYLSSDVNIVDLRSVVHFRVHDAVLFALGVENAEGLLRSLARRVLVNVVRRTPIDSIYTTARRSTEDAYREALRAQPAAVGLGVEVLDVRLLDVHAPASEHDAFRDVASSLEDREREIHVANGYAAERVAGAAGEASAIRGAARADATRTVQRAEGEVAAFSGLATVHATRPRTTETRLYLEALEQSLAAPRKYVYGTGATAGEVDLWLGNTPPPAVGLAGQGRASKALQAPTGRNLRQLLEPPRP